MPPLRLSLSAVSPAVRVLLMFCMLAVPRSAELKMTLVAFSSVRALWAFSRAFLTPCAACLDSSCTHADKRTDKRQKQTMRNACSVCSLLWTVTLR